MLYACGAHPPTRTHPPTPTHITIRSPAVPSPSPAVPSPSPAALPEPIVCAEQTPVCIAAYNTTELITQEYTVRCNDTVKVSVCVCCVHHVKCYFMLFYVITQYMLSLYVVICLAHASIFNCAHTHTHTHSTPTHTHTRKHTTLYTQTPYRVEIEYTTDAPGPWLTVTPTNGTLTTDELLVLSLSANPSGAPAGVHLARVVVVRTSWPYEVPTEEIVATVTVQFTVVGAVSVCGLVVVLCL